PAAPSVQTPGPVDVPAVPPRRRRPGRNEAPLEFEEEIVLDRYALIDAGKPVPAETEPSEESRTRWTNDRSAPVTSARRPDDSLDRIIPMIDAALATDGGPEATNALETVRFESPVNRSTGEGD